MNEQAPVDGTAMMQREREACHASASAAGQVGLRASDARYCHEHTTKEPDPHVQPARQSGGARSFWLD